MDKTYTFRVYQNDTFIRLIKVVASHYNQAFARALNQIDISESLEDM